MVGPEYGSKVDEIDRALEADEFELRNGTLHVAGEQLARDLFEIREERQYDVEGKLLQSERAIVIVS